MATERQRAVNRVADAGPSPAVEGLAAAAAVAVLVHCGIKLAVVAQEARAGVRNLGGKRIEAGFEPSDRRPILPKLLLDFQTGRRLRQGVVGQGGDGAVGEPGAVNRVIAADIVGAAHRHALRRVSVAHIDCAVERQPMPAEAAGGGVFRGAGICGASFARGGGGRCQGGRNERGPGRRRRRHGGGLSGLHLIRLLFRLCDFVLQRFELLLKQFGLLFEPGDFIGIGERLRGGGYGNHHQGAESEAAPRNGSEPALHHDLQGKLMEKRSQYKAEVHPDATRRLCLKLTERINTAFVTIYSCQFRDRTFTRLGYSLSTGRKRCFC